MARRRDDLVRIAINAAGAKIQFDHAALVRRRRQQMDMNLVGAKPRRAVADLGEIERRGPVLQVADGQNRAMARHIPMDEQKVRRRDLGAIKEIVDGVNVAPARCAAPELEPIAPFGSVVRLISHGHRLKLGGRMAAGSDIGELNDARSHLGVPAVYAALHATELMN